MPMGKYSKRRGKSVPPRSLYVLAYAAEVVVEG